MSSRIAPISAVRYTEVERCRLKCNKLASISSIRKIPTREAASTQRVCQEVSPACRNAPSRTDGVCVCWLEGFEVVSLCAHQAGLLTDLLSLRRSSEVILDCADATNVLNPHTKAAVLGSLQRHTTPHWTCHIWITTYSFISKSKICADVLAHSLAHCHASLPGPIRSVVRMIPHMHERAHHHMD